MQLLVAPSAVQAATAVDDAASTNEDSPVTIAVLSNDTGSLLKVSSVGSPAHGTVTIDPVTGTTLCYTPSPNWSGTDVFTYTISEGSTLFCPETGHYYEYMASAGIDWYSAQSAAASRSLYGLHGYLVTITSTAEQTFVEGKLAGQGWMGASDEAQEGTWRWVTGPEGLESGGSGRQFCTQTGGAVEYGGSTTGGSTPFDGQYSNWASDEPNNANYEDHGHFLAGGKWNDYMFNNAAIAGYVVEYGGMTGDTPSIPTATVTVTVNPVNDVPVITAGASTPVTMDEDGYPSRFGLTLDATDADGDTLTWSIATAATHGTATASGTGSSKNIGYTPTADYNGSDSFVVQVSDGYGGAANITVNVAISPRNDAPTNTVPPVVTGTPHPGQTLSTTTGTWNDSRDSLAETVLTYKYYWQRSTDGSIWANITNAKSASYIVSPSDLGYQIRCAVDCLDHCDNNLPDVSAEARSNVLVVANTAPVFGQGPSCSVTMSEDSSPTPFGLTLNATDADGDTLTWSIATAATHGTATASGTGSSKNIGYTPTADYNGSDSFVVRVADGWSGTDDITVNVTVNSVNDIPSFTKGADQTVLEDCGLQTVAGWATSISAGPADESGQALNFIVTNDNTTLFSTQPAVAANGTLTFTPGVAANGTATLTLTLTDDATRGGAALTTVPQTFTITVTAINDAPSFTKGADQTVDEDCGVQTAANWATAISAGPSNESGQTLNFIVTNDNSALFAVQPAVSPTGTLTYTPALNMNGSAIVTVQIHDDGGTANGGVDTSVSQTFFLTVFEVNDAPTAVDDAYPVLEDGILTLTPAQLLSNDVRGPANESAQNLALVDVGAAHVNCIVSLDAGIITVRPTPDFNGTASFSYTIQDNGTTAGTPDPKAASGIVTIMVTAVNDVPSFTKGAGQTVLEDCGAQTVSGWATSISAGPADESGQALNFIVTNDNTTLFSTQPAVAANGTLTYTLALNRNGSATVTICIHDDGGTANAGVDTSTPQTFTITVNPHNDPPVDTYTLTYTAGANGSISGASPQTVNYGASGSAVTAVPNTGYHFVQWSDGNGNATRTDTNVTANVNVSASFAITTYTIVASAGANGNISPSGDVTVNHGSSQSFTINPGTDYHVLDVLVDGSSVGAVTSYTFTNLTENHTIAVTFAINPITISTYTLTYTAGANGTISGTSPQTVNQGASSTAVTATPDAGYHFVSWSDGVATAARTDTNVTVNVNVSASFAININIHRYTLTANVSGSGSVAKSPDQPSYTHGTSVQLMATPATGWHFVGWSGDLSGTTNPATITMDVSKTVTATYAPLPHPVSRHTMVLTIDIKTMTVDGARVTLDAPAALLEDRTLVPLRALVEHLGGTISWNAKTRQVILKTRGTTMILTIGKSTALVNGKLLAIDPKNSKVVPILSSSRTMLPLRFVAENLGLQVEWDAKTRTITVNWED